jgi:hypothetical protein
METDINNKTQNSFINILQFYTRQIEKAEPVIKQGIDDLFAIYKKVWTEGSRLQQESIKKWLKNNTAVTYIENTKELGEKMIQIQQDSTHALADVSIKSLLSIIEASKKFTV